MEAGVIVDYQGEWQLHKAFEQTKDNEALKVTNFEPKNKMSGMHKHKNNSIYSEFSLSWNQTQIMVSSNKCEPVSIKESSDVVLCKICQEGSNSFLVSIVDTKP